MRDKEQPIETLSHTGATGPIQADQNFDLNILNEFILKELEEGEHNNSHSCDFTDPQIGEIRNQLMDQVPGWAAELMPMGTGPPQLVSRGTSQPQLVSRGTGQPQLVSRGMGSPPLVSRGMGSPQLVSRGTGPPQLVSRGTGPPQPASKDAASSDTRRKVANRPGRSPASSRMASRNFSRSFPNVPVKGEAPKLVITEQPKQRGMRFRYECEGRSAGSIPGENTTEHNKTLPTIQIQNWQGEVRVIISLVTKDDPHKPHPHSLVGKDCHDGICEVTVSPKCNMKASFANLGIQCMKKKEVMKAVEQRLKLGIDPFNVGDSTRCPDDVDMNVVRLCFQAFMQDPQMALGPILSEPIYDKKATNTSELRICRLNKDTSVCTGGEELFLLCDKVQKEDIAVIFSEGNWEAKGVFSQTDVHRQIAIVFKSPPYSDIDIQQPVPVHIRLYRPSDKEYSDYFEFRYLPKQNDAYGIRSKCKRSFKFPSINTFMDSSYTSPSPLARLKQTIESRDPAVRQKQTIGNRDFQFLANLEAYNFAKKEGEEYAELYASSQAPKPWNYFNREYGVAAAGRAPYPEVPLAQLQDELYNPCYMKDEPSDAAACGFYNQPEELRNCREAAEALSSSLDENYNALMAVDDLSVPLSEADLSNYGFGSEALSTILASSIAMPSDQAGTKD